MMRKLLWAGVIVMVGSGISFSDAQTPVGAHGLLKVKGTKLVGAAGETVQLKGLSLFWSQWGDKYWNEDAIRYVVKNWNVTVIRAAMGVEMGGYLEHKSEFGKVKRVVDIAKKLGIYVIIDWHDHNASFHPEAAEEFFREVARLYGNVPNVLFEPYNEPLNNETWGSVKAYAERVIRVIRKEGAQNIIMVGSPTWSQDVDSAALDPIKNEENIAYTLHFYAHSHGQGNREKAEFAMDRGLAVFVSEWGTCNASGDTGFDPEESDAWLRFMDKYQLSWCNWSLNDKDETASILKPGSDPKGGWTDKDLTESGKYVRNALLQGVAKK